MTADELATKIREELDKERYDDIFQEKFVYIEQLRHIILVDIGNQTFEIIVTEVKK